MAFTKSDHAEYLKSAHWLDMRKMFLDMHSCCERCQIPRWLAAIAYDQDLHAHHKSYANKGTPEEANDLEALCRRCHDLETFGTTDLRVPVSRICKFCGEKHWNPRASYCPVCIFICGQGDKCIRDYLPLPYPHSKLLIWCDLLKAIRGMVSGDEILDELVNLEVMFEERRNRVFVPICDEDIPF